MGPEAIVTIVVVGIIVGALALYLIIIAGILVKVSANLNKILNEVIYGVVNRTGNLNSVVGALANDVGEIERTMRDLPSALSGADLGDRQPDQGTEEEAESVEYTDYEVYQEPAEEPPAERRTRRRRVRARATR